MVVGLISLLLKNRPGGNVAYVEKYLYLMRVADPESESDSADIRRFTGMKTSWLFSLTLEILGCSMVKMKVICKLGFVAQCTQQYNY